MNRSPLLVLLCLLAAMPPQVCACDHSDHAPPSTADEHPDEPSAPTDPHDHDEHGGTPADDGGPCPCSCHVAARVACTTPRVADDQTCGLEYDAALATVAVPFRIPASPPTARSGEPPPGRLHPSVPLFLAVSRLLN